MDFRRAIIAAVVCFAALTILVTAGVTGILSPPEPEPTQTYTLTCTPLQSQAGHPIIVFQFRSNTDLLFFERHFPLPSQAGELEHWEARCG